MSNVLLILALAAWVYGATLLSPIVGLFVLGGALFLLAIAARDVKIRRPRLKIRRKARR